MWSVTDFWERGYCIGNTYVSAWRRGLTFWGSNPGARPWVLGTAALTLWDFLKNVSLLGQRGRLPGHVWRAEDNFWDLVLLVYYVGLGDGAQISRFDSFAHWPILLAPIIIIFFLQIFIFISVHVQESDETSRGPRISGTELYMAVSFPVWVLGTKLRSSTRVTNTLNYWVIPLALPNNS